MTTILLRQGPGFAIPASALRSIGLDGSASGGLREAGHLAQAILGGQGRPGAAGASTLPAAAGEAL